MSVVTNVILSASVLEEVEDDSFPAFDQINKWLLTNGFGSLNRVDQLAGGKKCMEVIVYMGAFNHLSIDDFKSIVTGSVWRDPDAVALFLCREQVNKFTDESPVNDEAAK